MASNQIRGQEAISKLAKLYQELASSINKASEKTKSFIGATQQIPSEYSASLEKIKNNQLEYSEALRKANIGQELYNARVKESKRVENELAKTKAKIVDATKSESRELQLLRVNLAAINKAEKENAMLGSSLVGAYKKQSIQLIRLKEEYKNLVAEKGKATRQSKRLLVQITKLDKKLKKVDSNVGEYKRSVGNYAKAMSGAVGAAKRLASAFGLVGGAFLIASTIKDAFRTLVEFDKNVVAVGKTANFTKEELFEFRERVVELGASISGISIQGLVKSAEVAGQLGIKGSSSILKFAETIEKLKLTSDIETEESVRQFAKFIEVSKDTVANVDKLGSVITELGNNFATSEKQILKNGTEIQKGISIYNVSAEGALALGAATSALGSEAEQSRSAMQKTFKVLKDAAVKGENLENVLRLTGQTAAEFKKEFSEDAIQTFLKFIQGLGIASEAGEDLGTTLDDLGLDAIRTEVVVGILAKNTDVLTNAVNDATTAYQENNATTIEYRAATDTVAVAVNDLSDAWDALVLSLENGQGPMAKALKGFMNFATGVLEGMKLFAEGQEKALRRRSGTAQQSSREAQLRLYRGQNAPEIDGDGFVAPAGPETTTPEQQESAALLDLPRLDDLIEEKEIKLQELKDTLKKAEEINKKADSGEDGARHRYTRGFEDQIEQLTLELANRKGQLEAVEEILGLNKDRSTTPSRIVAPAGGSGGEDEDAKKEAEKAKRAAERRARKAIEMARAAAEKKSKLLKEIAEQNLQNEIDVQKRLISSEESTSLEVLKATRTRVELEMALNALRVKNLEGTAEEIALGELKLQNKLLDIVMKGQEDMREASKAFEDEIEDPVDPAEEEEFDASVAEHRLAMIKVITDATGASFDEIADMYDNDLEAFYDLWERKGEIVKEGTALAQKLISKGLDKLGSMYDVDLSLFDKLMEEKSLSTLEYAELGAELAKGMYAAFAHDYDADLEANQEALDLALSYAEGSTAAQEDLKEKAALKEAEIKNKQLKQEKNQAIFKILMDTALGVMGAVAASPITLGLPWSGIIAGIGAAQVAAVMSREVPKFKDGVRDFSGGPAILGDGGRSEVGVLPSGQAFKTPSTDTLYNLPKGTDVYSSEKEFEEALANELNFNGILTGRNNLSHSRALNDSLTKEQFQQGIKDLQRTINSGETSEIIFDEAGIHKFTKKNNLKIEVLNGRFRGRGRKV